MSDAAPNIAYTLSYHLPFGTLLSSVAMSYMLETLGEISC